MSVLDNVAELFGETKKSLIQNSIYIKAPQMTTRPTWFMNGNTKSVKIGKSIFNYIDYLEAYRGINCNTYRSQEHLITIRKQIEKALNDLNNI